MKDRMFFTDTAVFISNKTFGTVKYKVVLFCDICLKFFRINGRLDTHTIWEIVKWSVTSWADAAE